MTSPDEIGFQSPAITSVLHSMIPREARYFSIGSERAKPGSRKNGAGAVTAEGFGYRSNAVLYFLFAPRQRQRRHVHRVVFAVGADGVAFEVGPPHQAGKALRHAPDHEESRSHAI